MTLRRAGSAMTMVGAAVLLGACGGSSSSRPVRSSQAAGPASSTAPSPPPARNACLTTRGYAGLYAPSTTFKANTVTKPADPVREVAYYSVLATSRNGCVAAYAIDELGEPPLDASDMVTQTGGINLPRDAKPVRNTGTCAIHSSVTLARASGFRYAVTKGTSQHGKGLAHAEVRLTNLPSC